MLEKYKRLKIGTIENESPKVVLPKRGELSTVPYAEPTWLSEGYSSPYYNDSHRALQKYMRDFVDEYVVPEAQEHENSGERPTVELIQECGRRHINHMRLGPGKHLHGLTLPTGLKGEDCALPLLEQSDSRPPKKADNRTQSTTSTNSSSLKNSFESPLEATETVSKAAWSSGFLPS